MLNSNPKWISQLPELDRAALEGLLKSSKGKIEKPREMIHVLCDINSEEQIQGIRHYLVNAGWMVSIKPSSENAEWMDIEAKKDNYILNEDTYKSDSAFFNRIASLYSIHYDGWYASN